MFCLNMLAIALELAREDPVYEDIATKFFEHFLPIAGALNDIGGGEGIPLWDEDDEFFYDVLHLDSGDVVPLKVRSMVGLIPLLAVETLDRIDPRGAARLPAADALVPGPSARPGRAVASWERARPGSSGGCWRSSTVTGSSGSLGGCSTRRVPVRPWGPFAQPLPPRPPVHARPGRRRQPGRLRARRVADRHLRRQFELARPGLVPRQLPAHRGAPAARPLLRRGVHRGVPDRVRHIFRSMAGVADDLSRRLEGIFLKDAAGRRPAAGAADLLRDDGPFRDRILFNEYFDGETGAGLGASHQTGWTALVAKLIEQTSRGSMLASGGDG